MIYKFTEINDVELKTDLKGSFFSSEWLTIFKDGRIIIKGSNKNGYSWDGCSPKFKIFGKIVGTPDGKNLGDYPETYFASMLHDVLYQHKKFIDFSRLDVDLQFKRDLEKVNFKHTDIYYFFVRKFGKLYGIWKIK